MGPSRRIHRGAKPVNEIPTAEAIALHNSVKISGTFFGATLNVTVQTPG